MKNVTYAARCLCVVMFLSISLESVSFAADGRRERHEHYKLRGSRRSHIAEDVVWPVIGFFGAITGVYALGRWCGWWGSESNEQLLARAGRELDHLHAYQPLLRIVKSAGYNNPLHGLDESVLYQLALAKRGGKPIEAYISCLKACLRDATAAKKALEKRSGELKYEGDWDVVRMVCHDIDRMASDMQNLLQELEPLHAYLQAHVSYFQLFECEDHIRDKYGRELQLLEQYGDDYALMRPLRACVMSKHSGAFALIEFVRKLKKDIARLDDLAARPAYNYATRIGYARDVVGRLRCVHECIISDGEYTRMLAEYERAQREKERIQLERERIRAEERKAQAREREAAAREREARAQETKNALKAAEIAERHVYERRY